MPHLGPRAISQLLCAVTETGCNRSSRRGLRQRVLEHSTLRWPPRVSAPAALRLSASDLTPTPPSLRRRRSEHVTPQLAELCCSAWSQPRCSGACGRRASFQSPPPRPRLVNIARLASCLIPHARLGQPSRPRPSGVRKRTQHSEVPSTFTWSCRSVVRVLCVCARISGIRVLPCCKSPPSLHCVSAPSSRPCSWRSSRRQRIGRHRAIPWVGKEEPSSWVAPLFLSDVCVEVSGREGASIAGPPHSLVGLL